MRLVSWNLNHRIGLKAIPERMVDAIAALEPDVLVLNEYVHGKERDQFVQDLCAIGLSNMEVSPKVPRQNQVLIASRSPLARSSITASEISEAFPPNVLHVHIQDGDFELLGLRIPSYPQARLHRACWDWIQKTADSVSNRPFVFIGDLNTDPAYPKALAGERFAVMHSKGWQHALPDSGGSYWTLKGEPRRIDHAFVSHRFRVVATNYVQQIESFILAGKGPEAMSDHATLVVEILKE